MIQYKLKCKLIVPKIDTPNKSTYHALSNIACKSFLATAKENYAYEGERENLFYIINFSFLASQKHSIHLSWHHTCKPVFQDTIEPALLPYKAELQQTLQAIEDGCHKTVEILCSPAIKEKLHSDIDSHQTLLSQKKLEIHVYIEKTLCVKPTEEEQNNYQESEHYISSVDTIIFSVGPESEYDKL